MWKPALVFLSANISTMSSDWHVGLQGDRISLFSKCTMCRDSVGFVRLQGRNPCQWGCPHDQKNLPKDFYQSLQDSRCSWRLCRLCSVPAYQTLCGSGLPASVCSLNSPLCVPLCSCSSVLGTHNSCSSAWDMCTLVLQLTVGESSLSYSSSLVLQTFTLWEPQYPGLCWYRINFLPRSWYSPVFSI